MRRLFEEIKIKPKKKTICSFVCAWLFGTDIFPFGIHVRITNCQRLKLYFCRLFIAIDLACADIRKLNISETIKFYFEYGRGA